MLTAFRALLAPHVAFGFAGLVAFWFPIFSKKGRTLHKRMGKVFLWAGYIVAGTAIFLAYLGVITLATVHHGVRVMQNKKDPTAIRTPFHTAVNGLAIASSALVLVFGITSGEIPLVFLSPLGLLVGLPALRYARRPKSSKMASQTFGTGRRKARLLERRRAFS